MNTMKAVGVTHYLPIDQADSLLDVEIPRPSASGHDLLVQVQAISVNPVDTKIRAPKDQVEENPRILGWDVAGIVVEVGNQVTHFQVGDEVFYAGSVTRAGGNSEYHLVDERIVGHKPKSLDFAAAAALPLTALTAWEAIHERLGISEDAVSNAGHTILIINAAGGVGSIATQMAHLAGLTVIGTASRPETSDWAKAHGADHVINHHDAFVPQLKKIGFSDVNYILCLNHTNQHWQHMADAIAPQGKICSIVETEQPIDLEALKNKSATFVWEFMFTRSMYETDDMSEQGVILNRIASQIDEGKLRTTETKRLHPINATQLREAHRLLEAGDMIGKLVLEDFES